MNYQEFQKRQQKGNISLKEKKPFNWEGLGSLANPMSIIAIISMIVFFKNLPVIPGIACLITAFLYRIQWKQGKCKSFPPIIWTINSIIWFINQLVR
jgi:hypothetical protein